MEGLCILNLTYMIYNDHWLLGIVGWQQSTNGSCEQGLIRKASGAATTTLFLRNNKWQALAKQLGYCRLNRKLQKQPFCIKVVLGQSPTAG